MLGKLKLAARKCGDTALELRSRGLITFDKPEEGAQLFSTNADIEAQKAGLGLLRDLCPDELIIAEEDPNCSFTVPKDCTLFDPIDGSSSFNSGCDEFGTLLMTLRGGQPVCSVMYYPIDKRMFSAERDKGWCINGKQQPPLTWDRPIDKTLIGHDDGPWMDYGVHRALIEEGFGIRSLMSAAWGWRELLLGHTGAYYNLNCAKIWDTAGAFIVQEAGGIVCNPENGAPIEYKSMQMDWVAAATPELASTILNFTRLWRPSRQGDVKCR